MPVEAYKSFGILSLLIFWLAIFILITKFRGHGGMTISKHAASHKAAYGMMAIVATITFPLLLTFAIRWFVPTFHLSEVFSWLFTIMLTCYLIVGWIPDSHGHKRMIHRILAYVAAILLIPLTVIILTSSYVSAVARSYAFVTLCYMLACFGLLTVFKGLNKYKLYFQIFYFLLFDSLLLVAAYIR